MRRSGSAWVNYDLTEYESKPDGNPIVSFPYSVTVEHPGWRSFSTDLTPDEIERTGMGKYYWEVVVRKLEKADNGYIRGFSTRSAFYYRIDDASFPAPA